MFFFALIIFERKSGHYPQIYTSFPWPFFPKESMESKSKKERKIKVSNIYIFSVKQDDKTTNK